MNPNPSVLIFSGVRGDTRRYRTFHPYQQMGVAHLSRELSHLTDPKLETHFQHADVVILHRVAINSLVEKLIGALRARGGIAIYDADDLVFDPDAFAWIESPDFQDPIRARLYKEDMLRYQRTLEACDAVTVSTGFLAQQVIKYNKPVFIHRNGFSFEMEYYSEKARTNHQNNPAEVIIGYASGTPTHQKDFNQVRPALEKLFARYPQAHLCLLGSIQLDSGWEKFQNQYNHRIQKLPLVPWRKLPVMMARWDVNLAPLVMDNPFTQSKSEIKYMEAALVGIPTIASPTEAFKFSIQTGQNGFLAANDGEWYNSLDLLMDQEVRNRMGQMALEQTSENYHPKTRANQLVEILNKICVRSNRTIQVNSPTVLNITPDAEINGAEGENPLWINIKEEVHPTLIEMGIYNLKFRSPLTLLQQIWIFFRRLISHIIPYRQPPK